MPGLQELIRDVSPGFLQEQGWGGKQSHRHSKCHRLVQAGFSAWHTGLQQQVSDFP